MNLIDNSKATGGPSGAVGRSEDARRMSPAAKIVPAAALFTLGLLLLDVLLLPFRHVSPFIQDDAFYYFEIARRIGLGQGSTCDGITKTNGYHPLWLLMLVPLSPIMNASREWGARVAIALAVLLLGGALLLLRAVAARTAPLYAAFALLYAWSALLFSSVYGMESGLAACLLGLLLWLIGRRQAPPAVPEALLIGLVSALLVLARLDSVWYVLALDVLWAARLLRASDRATGAAPWQALGAAALLQASIMGGYLAVNYVSFGHLLTVSALAKAGRFEGVNLAWLHGGLAYIALLSLPLSLAALWVSRRDPGALPVQVAAAGTLLSLLEIIVRGGGETLAWYFTLPVFCGGLFVSTLLAHARPNARRPVLWVMAAAAVLFLAVGAYSKLRPGLEPRYAKALWVAAHAPKNAVFASPDCGALSYASERSYLNMDGLTNSFGFQQAIQQDRVPQWLTKAGLNTFLLMSDHPPLRACDGRRVADVRIWRGMGGKVPQVHAVLVPEGPPLADSPFQLWHVVQILPGPSKQVDACTRVSILEPK